MSRQLASPTLPPVRLSVDYVAADRPENLLAGENTLAVFGFGNDAPHSDDPRYLRVPLQPHGASPFEVWRSNGPIRSGRDGDIAWSTDGQLLFGAIELDEHEIGIEAAAERIYAQLIAFQARSATPKLLRIWNYLDAITLGEGDAERYRRFCVGRARGIGRELVPGELPAATAIGHPRRSGRFQLYWLAARDAGTPLENPRQTQAWRYPRQYGPQAPGFARAMLPANAAMPLLLSGTAAVVGHASQHGDSLAAQLDETLANLDSLLATARARRAALAAHFGPDSRLKVYVRDADALPQVAALLESRLPAQVPRIVLHGQVCRRELAVEIDGIHA